MQGSPILESLSSTLDRNLQVSTDRLLRIAASAYTFRLLKVTLSLLEDAWPTSVKRQDIYDGCSRQ